MLEESFGSEARLLGDFAARVERVAGQESENFLAWLGSETNLKTSFSSYREVSQPTSALSQPAPAQVLPRFRDSQTQTSLDKAHRLMGSFLVLPEDVEKFYGRRYSDFDATLQQIVPFSEDELAGLRQSNFYLVPSMAATLIQLVAAIPRSDFDLPKKPFSLPGIDYSRRLPGNGWFIVGRTAAEGLKVAISPDQAATESYPLPSLHEALYVEVLLARTNDGGGFSQSIRCAEQSIMKGGWRYMCLLVSTERSFKSGHYVSADWLSEKAVSEKCVRRAKWRGFRALQQSAS